MVALHGHEGVTEGQACGSESAKWPSVSAIFFFLVKADVDNCTFLFLAQRSLWALFEPLSLGALGTRDCQGLSKRSNCASL